LTYRMGVATSYAGRMSAQRPDHGRRARALVGSSAWLAALLVPTVVLSVGLKIVRLMQAPATGPWWVRPADLVSDLTFGAAWIVGWWTLVVAGRFLCDDAGIPA
jgi:hypothetical protein